MDAATRSLGPPAGTLFYVENHLGSAVAQLDVDSKVVGESNFDVWGNPIVLTDEPYGFTGAEYDAEAGLQYLGSRYYDVKLGRFISVDEVVIDSTDVAGDDGQLLNVYSYARNTPTSLADRSGELPHVVVAAGIGALINTGIYLAKAPYNDTPITWKGALTAAVVGGVTGAVAAATHGAGLYASGAISGAVGGVLERGIETGSAAEAFSPGKMVGDAAAGAVTAGIVKAATPAVTKVVGGVVQRLGGAVKQVVEAIKPRCSGNCGTTIGCFVAGTPVLLATGALVPIEEVAEGDRGAAADEAAAWAVGAYTVSRTSVRQVDVVVDVDVVDEAGALERVTTTIEHPFAVMAEGGPRWVPAGELRGGESLAGRADSWRVSAVARRYGTTTVYNMTVDGAHDYFVGLAAVLVHNGGGDCLNGGGGPAAKGAAPKYVPKGPDGNPLPLSRGPNGQLAPSSPHPHTQIGWKEGRKGDYTHTREFGENGRAVKQVDWTDHGRPKQHTNPHVHDYIPTGGSPQLGPARPPFPGEF